MTWFAIRTAPQREIAVAAMLRRKGYDVFLPMETKWRKATWRAKRKTPHDYPMFARYLFVGGKFSWLELMAERHISGVVGFDGSPAPITDREIARIRAMSGTSLPHRHSVNPHRALRTGDMAEIHGGAFAGQIVKVAGLHGTKARIFVRLFGGVKEVEIATDQLEAA